jgi:hypothetical protein
MCGSCLAQSRKSRTNNGRDRRQNPIFSGVRISLRNGAFFDDIVDHEFERFRTKIGGGAGSVCALDIQAYEIVN